MDLDALNHGKQTPLLSPRKVGARPKEGAQREHIRGSASVAVTMMIKAGLPKVEAERRVALQLERAGYGLLGRKGIITARTVGSWRARAMEGNRKSPITRRYQDLMRILEHEEFSGNENITLKMIIALIMNFITNEMPPKTLMPPT